MLQRALPELHIHILGVLLLQPQPLLLPLLLRIIMNLNDDEKYIYLHVDVFYDDFIYTNHHHFHRRYHTKDVRTSVPI